MKKIIALASALMLLMCSVSCSKEKAENSDTGLSAENEAEMLSFRSADINMADDFSELICTDKRVANFLIVPPINS